MGQDERQREYDIDPAGGLWLFRASRLEALLDPLEALLAHLPPASLLAPQTVLVGHPGLRPWLRQQLAERRGPQGIVANLEFALPSPWLDRLATTLLELPLDAARPWQREVLRWRLLPMLGALDDARVQAVLAQDDGTQAFALAERLSAVLAPLMLYRADWLRRWARGESALPGDALLASAWRGLQAAHAVRDPCAPHRGERLLQLARRLNDADARPEGLANDPLHVFGLHHLAPPELAVLRALSRWRPVVFHVADPCREHWLGMGSGRAAMREALARDDLGEGEFLALDHPLLAAWGRLGQHFLLSLEDDGLALNERHGVDANDVAPRHLLDRLQHGLRRNDPRTMRVDAAGFAALPADASLRVHRCATPLRELEVLRDALAEAFVALPGLQPSDVVVLSPDLARYRPLLPAVFGEPGRRDGAWPWHAADVPLAAMHPVYRALAQALALPGTRLTAQGVLDLLAHAALARRFGLEGQSDGALRHALARLGVAWGFDAADRERFDAPGEATHTFDWGLDRAMAGHVFGVRDARPIALPDEARLLPGEGIDAPVAELLGRLHALLLELREWAGLGALRLAPAAWTALLLRRLDALFEAAPDDDDTRDALTGVAGLVAGLGDEWRDAGIEAPLPWPAVRDALQALLAAVPERQRFLVGGITFCGMVPQRAIPFRVVAVLGLDEGALPRHAPEDGFDLRARAPRFGDRDLASDDRYLFLETLMAARDRLHLSFIGIGASDGRARNPAAPLADLLDTLARFVPTAGHARPADGWPWERSAPLQPAGLLASSAPAPGATADAEAPAGSAADATSAPPLVPTLETLVAFFRDPARQALRDEAGVRLDSLEDTRLDDSEPLEPKADPREAMARGLAFDALESAAAEPPGTAPEALRLGGRLPPGALGEQLWREQRAQAMATLKALRAASPAPREPLSPPRRLVVSVPLGDGAVLEGGVDVREDADGTLWLLALHPSRDTRDLHFGHRLPALLQWLALRLGQSRPLRVAYAGKTKADALGARLAALDEAFLATTDADAREAVAAGLRRQLAGAIDFRAAVLRGERRYAPASSWVALHHGDDDPGQVVAAWAGGDRRVGERERAPGYAALWASGWHFVPGEGEMQRFIDDAKQLASIFGLVQRSDDADGAGVGE
jgi:exodeoxyribonuclease V gamma subunit